MKKTEVEFHNQVQRIFNMLDDQAELIKTIVDRINQLEGIICQSKRPPAAAPNDQTTSSLSDPLQEGTRRKRPDSRNRRRS